MALIKHHALAEDSWVRVADGDALPEGGDVIVSLSRFQEQRGSLVERAGKLGVQLTTADEPDAIAADVDKLSLIAIEFPKYVDGRGYSLARLLRQRHGFTGELRATGDVLRDQLLYMERCGFDAYELKAGKDAEGALQAFAELPVNYQGTVADPRPLFRRR